MKKIINALKGFYHKKTTMSVDELLYVHSVWHSVN